MSTTTPERGSSEREQTDRIVQLLSNPDAHISGCERVERLETHISWLFLTERLAFKLKKPVRYDFLDFSTVERRRIACEDEVKLNRRLAPGVYRRTVPITVTPKGRLRLGGEGQPIDWVVEMRRLPAEAAMDRMIREGGTVDVSLMESLAATLVSFYKHLPPVTMTVDDYRRGIERHVVANLNELIAGSHGLDQEQIRRVHSTQQRLLKLLPELLDDRARNGRVVEGHGDLRPEHIYFTPAPAIIDCIEFSREYRTLDVVDELAFLSMECAVLGADRLTDVIFQAYCSQLGDRPPAELVSFYRIYRACVRAKVCALRAEQVGEDQRSRWIEQATRYLELADRDGADMGPPFLILSRGLPAAGKSTIAGMLCEEFGFDRLQTDALRREIFGPSSETYGYNEGRYRPENRERVYREMLGRAERLLGQGQSIVLDGAFPSADLRQEARGIAERAGAQFLSIHCVCPDDVALRRIEERAARGEWLSETRPEFYAQQKLADQPDPPDVHRVTVDTSIPSAEPKKVIFSALREMCFKAS